MLDMSEGTASRTMEATAHSYVGCAADTSKIHGTWYADYQERVIEPYTRAAARGPIVFQHRSGTPVEFEILF